MTTEKIPNFEQLIGPNLKPNQRILSYETEKLLGSGENYGSIMLRIEVKVLNTETNKEELVHCVGKTVPPSEFLWKLFNTKATFKKEIGLYNVIIPAINNFGKERGIENLIDFVADSLGARISLNPHSTEVDKDAILLMENLKLKGYDMYDRFKGFDIDSSKLLLRDLAVMHAATIAYKLAEPEKFKTNLLPLLNKDYTFHIEDDIIDEYIEKIQNAVERNPKCVPFSSKIDKAVRNMKHFVENVPKGKEIFKTLTHNDYWTNNTLVKIENGKAIKNKMVDFQIIEYCSLAHDVVFFLYSSVEVEVLENHVDDLIKYYYDEFIETLVRLKCDVSAYSFESMLEEFAMIARDYQFSHLLYMLPPIHIIKGKAKGLSEFTHHDLILKDDQTHENYYRRMQFTLLDFAKKGWTQD